MVNNYVPSKGDIIWLSFNPVKGREQGKRRPALVISSKLFNRSGLCFVCPISSKVKGLRMEVPLQSKNEINGVVLPNHLKSLNWRTINAEFIEHCDKQTLTKVALHLTLIIGIDRELIALLE